MLDVAVSPDDAHVNGLETVFGRGTQSVGGGNVTWIRAVRGPAVGARLSDQT